MVVYQNHSSKFIWQASLRNRGFRVPVGKGGRLSYVGYAKTRYILDYTWMSQAVSNKDKTDYHHGTKCIKLKDNWKTFLEFWKKAP